MSWQPNSSGAFERAWRRARRTDRSSGRVESATTQWLRAMGGSAMKRLGRLRTAGLVGAAAWLLLLVSAGTSVAAPAVGPPYPDAVTGQRVYDYAGIFSPATITAAESIISGI